MVESIFFNPWIWIIPIILVIALVWFIADFWWDTMAGWFIGGFTLLLLPVFYFVFLLPPYDSSFYQTYRITGEVTKVEAAFNGEEGTMSQVFVAQVAGVDEFIRSDDQRFRTVTVGDDVNLVCSKEFRYFQEPWYECAFGGAR